MVEKDKKWSSYITELLNENNRLILRKLELHRKTVYILFIHELVDNNLIVASIINPLLKSTNTNNITPEGILKSVISSNDATIIKDQNKATDMLLKGHTLIILDEFDDYISVNTVDIPTRNVSQPNITNTVRGPKDCFTEKFEENLALIRYRIKNTNFVAKTLTVGEKTPSSVAIIYMQDIVDAKMLSNVLKKVKNMKFNTIVESGIIQNKLYDKKFQLFPIVGITDRSDIASNAVAEGKIVILVEGSSVGIIIPKLFVEFFSSDDDLYDNSIVAIFTKTIRVLALFFAITLSSLYIGLVNYNYEMLSQEYILELARIRTQIPFSPIFEVLIMEFLSEVIREVSIRVPKQIGTAVTMVGTIVISQVLFSASLISSIMIIITAATIIFSYIIADYSLMNAFRVVKIFLIFITALFGMYGFVIGSIVILTHIISYNSFGVPYFAPMAPFSLKDILNSLVLPKDKVKKPWYKKFLID